MAIGSVSRRVFLMSLAAAGCAHQPEMSRVPDPALYTGPKANAIVVKKSARRMYLFRDQTQLKSFPIELGFAPVGHKLQEGDGRTPEGLYYIDRRNPESDFHLSLGISYPNVLDRAKARAAGVSPGGNIFIHGGPRKRENIGKKDWTAGCIAVSDEEIEEVWLMVEDYARIWIRP